MEIVTRVDRPDLDEQAAEVFRERWPEFIFHDDVPKKYLARVEEFFSRYDIMVLDDDGAVVAGGWGVPLAWNGTIEDLPTGYDDAMVRAVEGREAGTAPSTLSFMAAAVSAKHDRRGLATAVLSALTARAREDGLHRVLAPLRPTWKHRYPLVPMAEYATWTRADGRSVDPWIRTHQRMGARVLGPAPRSMVIEGTVAEWESWADMAFPVTGDYVVPDALNLVHIDHERDRGVYVEENLWVEHTT
ncbi:GNAT family N-acetyltransferase [Asanoa sp. NPDC050611]|uniref:GNAT family N-acetyltransferase n=1 Tax=Asanoa sp. NPDC050611 TaxID=3157098 RepID=UPI0033DC2AC4